MFKEFLGFFVCSQTIVAINQVDGDAGFGSVPVDVDKLDDGYAIAVAIGGTDVGTIVEYLVTYDKEEETIVVTVYCGDVNGDGVANGTDADLIFGSTVGGSKIGGGQYNIGAPITFQEPKD